MDKLFESIVSGTLSLGITAIIIVTSALLGFGVSLLYTYTNKNKGYAKNFVITLIILPVVISTIILLVENSIARAFSLAGAFALIRFRSAPGDPIDISYIFFTLAIGLACGIGYIGYAIVFAILLSIILLILHFTKYGDAKNRNITLKISIPENLNYQDLFIDVFEKYTNHNEMKRVKTTDFGSIFVVEYSIRLKPNISQKDFIDELRCRNGNLNISLIASPSPESLS